MHNVHTYVIVVHVRDVCHCEKNNLGLSMELNDDILVPTSLQTTCCMDGPRLFCAYLHGTYVLRFHSLNARNSLRGDRFFEKIHVH